jgi:hypothetical protein
MRSTWGSHWGTRIRHSYKLRRLLRHLLSIRQISRWAIDFHLRPLIFRLRLRHVHGPKTIAYGMDELLVLCVVRNGIW